MHIPDGLLAPEVWLPLAGVSALAVAGAVRKANREADDRTPPLLGVTAAFVFAAQMVNFPVAAGTSAHFVGSALVGIALGPACGLVVMAAVLLIQCLLFQDGGLTALGANFFNMAILGVLPGSFVHSLLTRAWGVRARAVAAFFAAWLASVLPALACAVELAWSGVLPLGPTVVALGSLHAVTGIPEGVVTLAALEFLRRVRPDLPAGDGATAGQHPDSARPA